MLQKSSLALRSWGAVVRPLALRAQSSYAPTHHRTEVEIAKEHLSTLNDIPVPSGSWQEHYNQRNSKWNMLLGVTSLIFLGSAVVIYRDTNAHSFSFAEMKKTEINVK